MRNACRHGALDDVDPDDTAVPGLTAQSMREPGASVIAHEDADP